MSGVHAEWWNDGPEDLTSVKPRDGDAQEEREVRMPDDFIDELGPVDYVVVEFPPGTTNFNGDMAKELASLVEAELIRVYDVLIVAKDEDGTVEAWEIDDLDAVDALRRIESEVAEILAVDDVANLAEALEPGTTAGVLVWENTWAAPFATAARQAGGQLVANGRIPIQAIIASFEADVIERAH